MDGVGTSIVGRPRRLPADRRARATYTLIWEEPHCVWRSAPDAPRVAPATTQTLPLGVPQTEDITGRRDPM